MIKVLVKELLTTTVNIKKTSIGTYNSTANRLAQKIFKDVNNRDLSCPVCGGTNGTIIISPGAEMQFSKTGFCHTEFSNNLYYIDTR